MDHASIDMENLTSSLNGKLKNLHYPSSEECCIYRVPQSMLCLHPSDYTPQIVSIGPLHQGNPELQVMEEHKLRYLHHFLQRTKVSMAHFLAFIKKKETELRNCYAETINHLQSDEFLNMILVDAVFLVELFLRSYNLNLVTNDDRLFSKSGITFLGLEMRHDLYLLENQIPLFILNELFDLAKTATDGDIYEGISFVTIASVWLSTELILPIDDENLIEVHFSEAKHFLDLVILCLQQSHTQSCAQSGINYQNIPGVKELEQSGVQFKLRSSKNLLDIKFKNGILEIPFLTVTDMTERFYRNLLAFEHMHGYSGYFNAYVMIMHFLVYTPKDADLLIQNGIIRLGDSEKLSIVFHSLFKDCLKGPDLLYPDLVKDIQAFCKSPWHGWKANLKQNYFNTPWASISVIAAVILLLLTVTQTVCSFTSCS